VPLIVFEGIDGCGKTTQADRLCARLERLRVPARRLREPGGTALGEAMRAILLDPATKACPVAELFGYLQARAQLCEEVLKPALARGEAVVLDRFYHSTLAYQAYGLGLDPTLVRAANALALGGLEADLALWFALDPLEAQRRRAASKPDRIEARGIEYLTRVHEGYRAMAEAGELARIDAARAPDAVESAVWALIEPLVERRGA
jgi:dTMP kinase